MKNQLFRLTLRCFMLFLIACTLLLIVSWKLSPAKAAGTDEKSFYGVVKGEAGAPVKGIFVQARNLQTKILTSVLSDRQGRYWFDNLVPGEYEVAARGVGFTADRRKGVKLEAGQSPSLDFTVKSRPVQWTELLHTDYVKLLPERPGKKETMNRGTCVGCHGWRFLSMQQRDLPGWRQGVAYMREQLEYFLGPEASAAGGEPPVTDEIAELIASYLASVFGPEADLPQFPGIKHHEYSNEATNIVYVEYDIPTVRAFPWSAHPDNRGYVWIPEYGYTNQIAKLDPKTGEIWEYRVPHQGRAAIHSAVPAPDGMVWITEASTARKIAKFDPKTEKFTEYQDTGTHHKHTSVVDVNGNVWSSGGFAITRFDPATEKFTYYGDKPLSWESYGIATDKEGNVWFARLNDHSFGRIDAKTGKVTEWSFPNSGTRRVRVDSKGFVWHGQHGAGKAVRFDPKTETFKEYKLPGPNPSPYGVAIDANDDFWYFSQYQSEFGRLDPNTGRVTRYPVPYDDIGSTARDLHMDSEGRMWFNAGSANRVGYFYLRNEE